LREYATSAQFASHLSATRAFWQQKVAPLQFATGDEQFDRWLKWVAVQPTLRRLFGNSFLPYHDYGRGGRGWRDLWQDILALLLMETGPVDGLLSGNFAGVRLDGSNATIIGSRPGEFKADRNNIPRVWMDHGLWPLTTTQLYLDQTGDLGFLLRQQAYFQDGHTHRCRATDPGWSPGAGTQQRTAAGAVYQGSILEHLLVQHLTAFFNVGEHNNILLEGADWNDGMDMARQRGESVAFTAFYASNLRQLSRLVLELESRGEAEIELMTELLPLLDRLGTPVDYASPRAKQSRLDEYFAVVGRALSGEKARVPARDLAADLAAKADGLVAHLRANEWIRDQAGFGWFNGYYDNDGAALEGDHPLGARMTLTGQVFALMGAVATDEQAREILRAVNQYLYDASVGGYRLNTNFHKVLLNMGRCFGFAYGHKENGAMFSHMAVMFAYALYERGFVRQAYQALDSIYRQSVDFPTSRMYPGIPEYFSQRGRGMYPYLTGSASWYLLTLVTQAFGVRGSRGDLLLAPRLVREQFDADGNAALTTLFAGRSIRVIYHNPDHLDAGEYHIKEARLSGQIIASGPGALIPRAAIAALPEDQVHEVTVELTMTP
jgi:cellobiose phosphorylase